MAATEPNAADLRRLRRVVCGCKEIGWAMAFLLPQSPHFSSRNFCFAKHTLIVGIRLELEAGFPKGSCSSTKVERPSRQPQAIALYRRPATLTETAPVPPRDDRCKLSCEN